MTDQVVTGWQPIETAPIGKNVLIVYTREGCKKPSVIKAFQCGQYELEADDDNHNSEYCADTDTDYIPAGWYKVIENWVVSQFECVKNN